ncbi:MAG: DUF3365 domain-containing protein [Desulfocurvibacter africanus]
MSFPRLQTIQHRFLLGLAILVFLFGLFFSAGLYFHLRSLLHSEVTDKAKLVLAQVDSVQIYVRESLRPKMYEKLPSDEFIIEAMSSSYISRRIMEQLNASMGEYHHRRVAENARNPDFEINELEAELLQHFRNSPGQRSWEGYRKIDDQEYFVMARPVFFEQSCMTCHGSPEQAPKELIDRYGGERGFGRKLGALDGLDVVGLPVQEAVLRIREATASYIGIYIGGILLFFALIQFFFNRLVVDNLRRLALYFRVRFQDHADTRLFDKLDKGDEIDEMVQGMEELGDHLLEARRQLQNNAADLERTVASRTEDLSREASERKADVQLFVRLLDGLNRSMSRRDLWKQALPRIGERFGADEVSFMCMVASQNFHTWPDARKRPDLPDDWRTLIVDAKPYFTAEKAIIPVGASASFIEGLLFLTWSKGDGPVKEQDQAVLRALGQQLGIALENLSALDNLVRQKDVLASIIEGISDPLLFMDENCSVILANQAARSLAETLAKVDKGEDGEPGRADVDTILPRLFKGEGDCLAHKTLGHSQPFIREIYSRGGRSFFVSLYPVTTPSGSGGRMVVYIRENTQEKRVLARMQQGEKLATVGKLAAGLAHEINNPLGVILCYAQLLRDSLAGVQEKEDVEVIIRHTRQARNVLQDLLNFARPKKDGPEIFDIRRIAEVAAKVFQVHAEAKRIRLTVESSSEPLRMYAPQQVLEQILTNLLNNALDAVTPGEGEVVIRTFREAEHKEIVLQVIDNGPGVPEEHMAHLFDPFFTTKEVGQGTGLALAVVYGLVRDLGGRIEVSSASGAVFTLFFPNDESLEHLEHSDGIEPGADN